MLCGARQPDLCELDNEKLLDLALWDLDRCIGIKSSPEKLWIFRYEKGIPQYTLGHTERIKAIFEIGKSLGGLFFHSNAYKGVGLNDCVGFALERAKEVAEFVKQR